MMADNDDGPRNEFENLDLGANVFILEYSKVDQS